MIRLWGSSINTGSDLVNSAGLRRLSVTHSIVDTSSGQQGSLLNYGTNLSRTPTLNPGVSNTLPRTGWSASASHHSGANNMLDNNLSTRWGGWIGHNGDGVPLDPMHEYWIRVDMGAVREFDTVLLNQGTSPGDRPGPYVAEVSNTNNGTDWEVKASGVGTNGVTIVRFGETVQARYVRIRLTDWFTGRWWSVCEFDAALMGSDKMDPPESGGYGPY